MLPSAVHPQSKLGYRAISCLLFLHVAQSKQECFEGGPHAQLQLRKITVALGIYGLTLNMFLAHHHYFFFKLVLFPKVGNGLLIGNS